VSRAEAYVHAKFHLDPFNRLVTITNVTYRMVQDRTDRTDNGPIADSIGQTALQTVVQKTIAGLSNALDTQ